MFLQPSIDEGTAREYATRIAQYSEKHNQDPFLVLAIARQESGLDHTVVNRGDYGLFQFHVDTMKYLNMDPNLVTTDLDYTFIWFFKILEMKQKVCRKHQKEAWSCYHSKTPRFRKKYVKDVMRYYLGNAPNAHVNE